MASRFVLDFLRLCLWLLILVAVFIPLERLFGLRRQQILRSRFLSDIFYYFVSSLLPKAALVIPMALAGYAAHVLIPVAIRARVALLPGSVRFACALVIAEVGYYWGHRWSHVIPWLWRFHAIHHSAEEMDWLVNTRAHPVDIVFTRLCGVLPIYVLGLSQVSSAGLDYISLAVVLTSTLWGFFIHANLRWCLGPLEWLVASPAFHHWHHTYDEPLDRNFSPMFPVVDRLFGTHYSPKGEWPARYGTETAVPESFAGQMIEPFIPAGRALSPDIRLKSDASPASNKAAPFSA